MTSELDGRCSDFSVENNFPGKPYADDWWYYQISEKCLFPALRCYSGQEYDTQTMVRRPDVSTKKNNGKYFLNAGEKSFRLFPFCYFELK